MGEMACMLPVLGIAQIVYVMVCLPPVGSLPQGDVGAGGGTGTRGGGGGGGGPGKGKRRHGHGSSGLWNKIIVRPFLSYNGDEKLTGVKPAILSLILTTLLATPALSILLVLFGAPLTTHHLCTLLCGAHMAVLTSVPLIYVHGVDGAVWREIWAIARPGDVVWGGALGTGIGGWMGAVPIPLDWYVLFLSCSLVVVETEGGGRAG